MELLLVLVTQAAAVLIQIGDPTSRLQVRVATALLVGMAQAPVAVVVAVLVVPELQEELRAMLLPAVLE